MTVSYRGCRKWLKCFAALNMSYYCTPAVTVVAARQTQIRHRAAFITPMDSLGPCFHHEGIIPWLSQVAEVFCSAEYEPLSAADPLATMCYTVIVACLTQIRHTTAFITPMASLGPCFH